ncbi:MAG: hypothetical protein LLG14_19680 [Nocardiaceae bacterium]|nr:hypothetical protein [Nocardiaceae bacterium]
MDSRLATQCIALGAAGALIAQTLEASAFPIAEAPAFAVAGAAAIAAVLSNKPRWLEAGGVAGLAVLVLVQFVSADPIITTIGAGLVLGCAAGLAKTPLHQAVLAGGVAVGIVLDGMLWEVPGRYAEYLAAPSPDIWRLALIGITAVALLWATWASTPQASAQVMAVSIGLPLAVAAAIQLDDHLLMSLAVAASVVVAAFLLPGRSGLAVLAGGAIAASWTGLGFTTPLVGAIIIGLVVAALALGLRKPQVPVGIAVVAVCLLPFHFLGGLAMFVAAVAAAFAYSSSIPVPAPVAAIAAPAPFYLAAATSSVHWVAYTPLSGGPTLPPWLLNGWLPFAIVAAYAGAAFALSRR